MCVCVCAHTHFAFLMEWVTLSHVLVAWLARLLYEAVADAWRDLATSDPLVAAAEACREQQGGYI